MHAVILSVAYFLDFYFLLEVSVVLFFLLEVCVAYF